MPKDQQDDNDSQQGDSQPSQKLTPASSADKHLGGSTFGRKEQEPKPQAVVSREEIADGLVEQWSDRVEMEPEVEEHVERVVRGEVDLPDGLPVVDEEGKKVLEAAQAEEAKIVLPIDESTAQQGKKSPVSNALSWLWEFCKRTILKYPGKVIWPQK
jgi:hypothetical protein